MGKQGLRLLALLVCEKDAAMLAWIKWRFAMIHDYLLENSLMYKELVQEGRIKGLEEGLRQSIEMVVQARFPALLDFAKERMALVQEQSELQRLLVAMSVAKTERKARRFLLAFPDNS